ncbi:MAG: patatin-like phospholipase family protein [Steroidobacteraceae bacterium]
MRHPDWWRRPMAVAALALLLGAPLAQAREKIGLVLGGGGARGAAHIGVLRALEREHIPVDYIAGTSMGAIIGALYASGYSVDEIQAILDHMDWGDVFRDGASRDAMPMRVKELDRAQMIPFEVGVDRHGLEVPPSIVIGQKLNLVLRRLLVQTTESIDFDSLPIPFRCVATDVGKAEEVVFGDGDLTIAVLASASIPGAFAPVRYDGRLLVDGMVTDNIPVDVARRMGADRLIVVNVSEPLLAADELTSPVSILTQVLSGLVDRESARVLATLTANDLVLRPDMPGITSLDFAKVGDAVRAGESAAVAQAATLRRFAVDPAEYAALRATQARHPIGNPRIEFVDVRSDSSRTAGLVRDRLYTQKDKAFSFDEVSTLVDRAFGAGTYQRIDYRLEERGGGYGLIVRPVDKAWGPNYLRFGLQFEDDFKGRDDYQLNAELRMTGLSATGAEWRNLLQLGRESGITSEFYAPFGALGRWFLSPQLQYLAVNQPLRIGNDEAARYRVDTSSGELRFGRDFGEHTRIAVVASRSHDRGKRLVGAAPFPDSRRADLAGVRLQYLFDSLDSVAFPTRGGRIEASYGRYGHALGAHERGDLARLSWDQAVSYGRNTVSLGARASVSTDNVTAFSTDANLGGLTYLSGFGEDELLGSQMLFARVMYYRSFGAGESLISMPLYVGFSAETGNVWDDFDAISGRDLVKAGSVFVGVPLPIGPLRFGFGYADSGDRSFYLTFGSYVRPGFH